MLTIIIFVALACIGLITLVLVKPSVNIKGFNISIYWLAPLLCASLILLMQLIPLSFALEGLTSDTDINPLKILVLFISMTVLSIYADEAGFFSYLAAYVLRKSKSSQMKLFVFLYLIVSVLTIFTSNDIIILTFTPFICYFCKSSKISPLPFLLTEFVAANTWSMMLIIGNPTNIYLATAAQIDFIEYFLVMLLPTLFSGLISFGVLFLIFRRSLQKKIEPVAEEVRIKDKGALAIALAHLIGCTLMLILSGWIAVPMWIISFSFLVSLFFVSLIYFLIRRKKPYELAASLKRAPWELIPFVISMFILVLALNYSSVTQNIAALLGSGGVIIKYGLLSFLSANLINNIPMSVMFSSIAANLSRGAHIWAVYASVIGSNIGAFFTPIGALAGIMWMGILKKHNVEFGFFSFIKYGAVIAVPTILAALGGLYLSLFLFS